MGSIRTTILQECTLCGVNVDLSVTRRHVLWGQSGPRCYKNPRYMGQCGLECYKKARYIGSIRTTLLQESTLHGVNVDLSVTRRHVIWGQ